MLWNVVFLGHGDLKARDDGIGRDGSVPAADGFVWSDTKRTLVDPLRLCQFDTTYLARRKAKSWFLVFGTVEIAMTTFSH